MSVATISLAFVSLETFAEKDMLKNSVKTKTVKLNFVPKGTQEAVDFTVSLEGVNSENSADSSMQKGVKVLEMTRKLKN